MLRLTLSSSSLSHSVKRSVLPYNRRFANKVDERISPKESSILISGGGIAGLTTGLDDQMKYSILALALKQKGFKPTIFEMNADLSHFKGIHNNISF